MKQPLVSIIIVNYHVEEELIGCIASIYNSRPQIPFEIIVVDNDETKSLQKSLYKKYPKVIYTPNINKGFGQGNNVGTTFAHGEYLFFLNPDTTVFPNTIDNLYTYIKTHTNVGIVAPLLIHQDKTLFTLQGVKLLTPWNAIFSLSFIHTLFPHNPIATDYWNKDWDKKSIREVGSVPGTAFMIKKKLFEQVGGFDETYFLYFEETDLCKRVLEMRYKLIMYPHATVFHAWEQSTKKSNKDLKHILEQSRFYYFKKHFGLLTALFTESILRISFASILLTSIFLFGLYLRTNQLTQKMAFIGDQGWFYLSARDTVLGKSIPLVGITSSHTWLHQGALWTYFLSLLFILTKFNPLVPGYTTAIIDSLTVFLIYVVTKKIFSRPAAIVSSLLYATSPLLIIHSRMPFITSFIPPVVLFFVFSLAQFYQYKKVKYFYLICFLLGILYNLELATIVFAAIFLSIFLYLLLKKEIIFAKNFFVYLKGFLWFSLPMLPIYLYDLTHGFKQTIVFGGWLVYHFVSPFLLHKKASFDPTFWQTSLLYLQKTLFASSGLVSLIIFIFTILAFIITNTKKQVTLLGISFGLPLLGYIVSRVPSEAYIPMLIPTFLMITGGVFAFFWKQSKIGKLIIVGFLLGIATVNITTLVSKNYYIEGNPNPFTYQVHIAKQVIKASNHLPYHLKFVGPGDQFPSSTMQYAYLTWWLGYGPSSFIDTTTITLTQTTQGITIARELIVKSTVK